MRLLSVSGLSLALLGTLHLVAHLLLRPAELPPVFAQMAQTPIELMGTHTLLQFHEGFSLTMGALMVGYGSLVALVATEPVRPAVGRLHAVFCAVMVGLSALYFHPLAWGMSLLAMVLAVAGLLRPASPATRRSPPCPVSSPPKMTG